MAAKKTASKTARKKKAASAKKKAAPKAKKAASSAKKKSTSSAKKKSAPKKAAKTAAKKKAPAKKKAASAAPSTKAKAAKAAQPKKAAKRGEVTSSDVNLGHIFALKPRVNTSFRPNDFMAAKRALRDETYASVGEAARAVAEKALEMTRGDAAKIDAPTRR